MAKAYIDENLAKLKEQADSDKANAKASLEEAYKLQEMKDRPGQIIGILAKMGWSGWLACSHRRFHSHCFGG